MSRPLVVLRPEPGNARTAAAIRALGHRAIRLPLFAVAAVPWTRPAGRFDALMLTSANAVRYAGPSLQSVRALPVVAVGKVTAAAARTTGLDVALTGEGGAAALAAAAWARGFASLLHLAGYDHTLVHGVTAITVYASDPVSIEPAAIRSCRNAVVLLHSARAAHRFATLVEAAGVERAAIRLAGLSRSVIESAGQGWQATVAAALPTDAALVARAVALAD